MSVRLLVCAAVLGTLTTAGSLQAQTTMSINPKATYLRTSQDPSAVYAFPIDLAGLGILPGNLILLEQLGDFKAGTGYVDTSLRMMGVFSETSTLLPPNNLHRVPGAIDAGTDFTSSVTYWGGLSTDIPEDFEIANTTIEVPSGAKYLFAAAHDSLYGDNTDPDGDYAVRITVVPEPSTFLALISSLGALAGIRSRRARHTRQK